MNIKLSPASNIFNFPDIDYGKDLIIEYLSNITGEINDNSFPDWTLRFTLFFSKGERIGIYKRGNIYPSDKEKELTIIIPIPTNDECSWGIDKKRFAKRPPIVDKNFKFLPVDYEKFENLKDYIVDSAKNGIKIMLEDGITLKGTKFKISQ